MDPVSAIAICVATFNGYVILDAVNRWTLDNATTELHWDKNYREFNFDLQHSSKHRRYILRVDSHILENQVVYLPFTYRKKKVQVFQRVIDLPLLFIRPDNTKHKCTYIILK